MKKSYVLVFTLCGFLFLLLAGLQAFNHGFEGSVALYSAAALLNFATALLGSRSSVTVQGGACSSVAGSRKLTLKSVAVIAGVTLVCMGLGFLVGYGLAMMFKG